MVISKANLSACSLGFSSGISVKFWINRIHFHFPIYWTSFADVLLTCYAIFPGGSMTFSGGKILRNKPDEYLRRKLSIQFYYKECDDRSCSQDK